MFDTSAAGMSYPTYFLIGGPRKGWHTFIYVTEAEYLKFGEQRAKIMEADRIRSKRISESPELRAKWSARRAHRRKTEPGLRAHEVELQRRRRLTSKEG
jgi:hypothetical protein